MKIAHAVDWTMTMTMTTAGRLPMASYSEIQRTLTSISAQQMREHLASGCAGIHESVMRSYQILEKVKWLLERDTHPEVLKELIDHMESEAANG